jgi:polysaccharide deacetylase 2 family uncharacterized protein YibQ
MKKRQLIGGLSLTILLTGLAAIALFWPDDHQARHSPPYEVRVKVADQPLPPAAPPSLPSTPSELAEAEKSEPQIAFVTPPLPPITTPPAAQAPRIAIVIDDMGLSGPLSRRATELPAPITLSYLPYAPQVQQQVDAARAKGHEIMLHLPMEPMGNDNPGPEALLVNLAPDELAARLDKALNAFHGYDGVNNHMGSKFTSDAAALQPVMQAIKQRGVFFLDSRTSGQSQAENVAREHDIPTIGRDVFLDDVIEPAAIRAQLARAEAIARRRGSAIAIGHPHPATLQELAQWLPDIQARGFRIVRVRDLLP